MKADEYGYLAVKHFEGGKSAWVMPLTFGRARIIYGGTNNDWLDDGW